MPAKSPTVKFDSHEYALVVREGEASYREEWLPLVAERIATGQQSYANLPPDQGTVLDISDFSQGFGASVYVPGGYWYTRNGDLRVPGRARLGPRKRSRALTADLGRVRGFFERNDRLCWTQGQYLYSVGGLTDAVRQDRDFGDDLTPGGGVNFRGGGIENLTYVPLGAHRPYQTWDGAADDDVTVQAKVVHRNRAPAEIIDLTDWINTRVDGGVPGYSWGLLHPATRAYKLAGLAVGTYPGWNGPETRIWVMRSGAFSGPGGEPRMAVTVLDPESPTGWTRSPNFDVHHGEGFDRTNRERWLGFHPKAWDLQESVYWVSDTGGWVWLKAARADQTGNASKVYRGLDNDGLDDPGGLAIGDEMVYIADTADQKCYAYDLDIESTGHDAERDWRFPEGVTGCHALAVDVSQNRFFLLWRDADGTDEDRVYFGTLPVDNATRPEADYFVLTKDEADAEFEAMDYHDGHLYVLQTQGTGRGRVFVYLSNDNIVTPERRLYTGWTDDETDKAVPVQQLAIGSATADKLPNTTVLDGSAVPSLGHRANTQALYVASEQPFEGMTFTIALGPVSDKVLANSAEVTLSVEYWRDTGAWHALGDVTYKAGDDDSEIVGLSKNGYVEWTLPTDWVPLGEEPWALAYWARLKWSATLSPTTKAAAVQVRQRDTAVAFAAADAKLYRVAREASGYELYETTTSSRATGWQRLGQVSDLDDPVLDMQGTQGLLWIWCERSLKVLQGDGADLRQSRLTFPLDDDTAGVGGTSWIGNVWSPTEVGLLRLYNDRGFAFSDQREGPQAIVPNASPASGRIGAAAGDAHTLWATIRAPGQPTFLLNYLPSSERWHTIAVLKSDSYHAMTVSRIGHATNPVLWMGGSTDLTAAVLPRTSWDPGSDPNYEYHMPTADDPASIYLGQVWTGFPAEQKCWIEATLLGEDLSAAQTARLSWRNRTTGAYTQLAAAFAEPLTDFQTLPDVEGKLLDLRIDLATDDHAETPLISQALVRYAVRFRYRRRIEFDVKVERTQPTGAIGLRTTRGTTERLRASCEKVLPVELRTLHGETLRVFAIPGSAQAAAGSGGQRDTGAFFRVVAAEV